MSKNCLFFFLFLEKCDSTLVTRIWLTYVSTRLFFTLIMGILSDKYLFSVWFVLYYIWNSTLFSVFWMDLHLTDMESGDPPCGLGFYFANMLVLSICKPSLFQWLKEKKISWKGRWRLKLQLLWLFWLEMSECWSKRCACCFLTPSIQPTIWKLSFKMFWASNSSLEMK